ncbi:type II toxin-antitoxin system death-on-curing family toxin [Altererythrobacter soli]|uniref:Type II toxin-antitoxin system death-on-curing family toxin n=1 Tax=Croceibacterium soli TaxID=1739690 RepID=A0A6I4UUV7_9SPHN|nr:type II toxin-antitoxin system death-on-curing family toxin [Croceibacterium soli]MXP42316.1 type II toxin-antitoxin system death-on-curing family toxin [Croceibacterium soli]
MTEWVWLREDVVLAFHDEQLAEHGGAAGIRDRGLLDSALARPQNLQAYGEPDAAALAAAYAYGIARNHPFVDGNKRTAAVAALLFLDLNSAAYSIGEAELVVMVLALAAGELSEDEVAQWFRERLV